MGLWAEDFYKNRLKSTWKLAFFSAFLIGLLVHMFKLANVLPYWDSLMNHYSSQDMVASGRWFLSVACSLSSHFDLPWLNGILSLLLLGITAAVIAEHFGMESPVLIILSSGLLVSFPAVTATFAYSYTADGYMVAMLLAALAATLSRVEDIRPDRWKRLLLSSLLLCLSCGIYQAYVSFAFMLAVGRAILELLEGKHRPKDFLRWIGAQVLIFGIALGACYGLWKLILLIRHIPATTYQGLDGVGSAAPGDAVLRILRDLVLLIVQWNFFERGITAYAVLNILTVAVFFIGLLLRLRQSDADRSPCRVALLVLLVIAIPFGCYIWHFASNGVYYHPVMLQSAVIFFILTGTVYDRWFSGKAATAAALLLAAVIFSNSVSANVFYDRMHLRYERDYSTAVELNTRIHLVDDGSARAIVFYGDPQVPETEDAVYKALGGCWLPERSLTSWYFLDLYTDFELPYYRVSGEPYPVRGYGPQDPVPWDTELRTPLLSEEEWSGMGLEPAVSAMPLWPAAGSVERIGDVIVVRFS